MMLNTKDFLRKMQHPLVLALACFPLVLFLTGQHAPGTLHLVWVLPAAYVLLSWVCLLLPGKMRLPGGVLSIAAMLGVTAYAWPVEALPAMFVPMAVYTVLMLITLPMAGWEQSRELGLEWHVIGTAAHLLVQLLINGAQKLGNTAYDACEPLLVVSFLALAVLLVLALNRQSLNSASQARQKIPLPMRRMNRVLVLFVLVIGVLIALISAIGQALTWVWDLLVRFLLAIGTFLSAIMPGQGSGSGGDGGDSEPLEAVTASEPSALALLMEKVMTALTIVIIVVGAFFLLRALLKRLKKLLRYLWERLGRYSAAVSEDYEDEVTSTREDDAERESLLGRLRRFAPEDERGLDATQRVRVRYRSLKRRRRWTTASTARETLPEEAARLYERARYGGEALTDAEAERFRDATKKV